MQSAYPTLDQAHIRQQLAHAPIGHTLVYHTAIPSTMPIAAELAHDPATPSGVIVVAEEQTSGRGRRGRAWHAPRGSALLVSILLKLPHTHLPAATLIMVGGNALRKAVASLIPEIATGLHLKWPNDLVVGNDPASARKVAGILSEASLAPDGTLTHAILGIGINVNQQSSELPRIAPPTPRPISLRVARALASGDRASGEFAAANALIDRSALLVQLCQQVAQELTLTPAESYQQWKAHLNTLGHTVTVYGQGVYGQGVDPHSSAPEATLIGQAVDVQHDGALVVEANQTRHVFHAADVSIRAQ